MDDGPPRSPHGALKGIGMHHEQAKVVQGKGDSTMVGLTENPGGWFGLIGDVLRVPDDATVWMSLWNETRQAYEVRKGLGQ